MLPVDQIITGDALDLCLDIPNGSVDLIFTDPPYKKKYLNLYGWLGRQAKRILKPDGFLLAYTGTYHKATVMEMLNIDLSYFWDFIAFGRNGPGPMIWERRIISKHKSILAYRKCGSCALPRTTVLSVWVGSGHDKQYHVWQQDESTARYYVDCFSKPGDLVVDFFCGSGTTAAVCKILDRRYLAYEIDPAVADVARARVEATRIPWFAEHDMKQPELALAV